MILAIAMLLLLAMAVPAFAGGNGKAGKSDTYHCYFTVYDSGYDGPAWGKIMFQDDGDSLSFVANFHDLEAGDYMIKSGGFIAAEGSANRGGNLNLRGSIADEDRGAGARFNLFMDGTRILRTDPDMCELP
jgi:hypothetical protein